MLKLAELIDFSTDRCDKENSSRRGLARLARISASLLPPLQYRLGLVKIMPHSVVPVAEASSSGASMSTLRCTGGFPDWRNLRREEGPSRSPQWGKRSLCRRWKGLLKEL